MWRIRRWQSPEMCRAGLGLVQLSQWVIAKESSGQQGGIGDDLIRKTWMSDRPMMGPRLTEDLMITNPGYRHSGSQVFSGGHAMPAPRKGLAVTSAKCAGGTCPVGSNLLPVLTHRGHHLVLNTGRPLPGRDEDRAFWGTGVAGRAITWPRPGIRLGIQQTISMLHSEPPKELPGVDTNCTRGSRGVPASAEWDIQ